MNITIPPELESRLRARAEAEGLTIEGYIERIARDDQQAEEKPSSSIQLATARSCRFFELAGGTRESIFNLDSV